MFTREPALYGENVLEELFANEPYYMFTWAAGIMAFINSVHLFVPFGVWYNELKNLS